jgi:hypothetical protein
MEIWSNFEWIGVNWIWEYGENDEEASDRTTGINPYGNDK